MAIGDPYVTIDELKAYLKFEASFGDRDGELLAAAMAASEKVEQCCNRQFNKADVATERLYEPTLGGRLVVDDFWTTDGLVISGDEGTSWELEHLSVRPLNGIVAGRPGWPFYEIRPTLSPFPVNESFAATRATVSVTAKWGWAEVPGPVRAAAKLLAGMLFSLADAPLGVAGFSQFGAAIRVQNLPPQVKVLLSPYDRNKLQVG